MKTARQWFDEKLPEDIAKKAVANIEKKHKDTIFESIRESFYQAFRWADSKEGYQFWFDVFVKYK